MHVDADQEEFVRNCEYQANGMIRKLRADFPDKSMKELLAMAAFQYTKAYYTLRAKFMEQHQMLEDFEARLDELLELTARVDSGLRQ